MAVRSTGDKSVEWRFRAQESSDTEERERAATEQKPVPRAISALDCTTGPIILTEHERVLLRRIFATPETETAAQRSAVRALVEVFSLRNDDD